MKDYLSPLNPNGIEPLPSAITVNGVRDGVLRYQAKRTDKVRVRVINAGAFTLFNVSVDGMVLKIIELDGQDVEPIEVSWFLLSTAQRASFVLDFSQLRTLPKAMASSSSIYMRFLAAEEMQAPAQCHLLHRVSPQHRSLTAGLLTGTTLGTVGITPGKASCVSTRFFMSPSTC